MRAAASKAVADGAADDDDLPADDHYRWDDVTVISQLRDKLSQFQQTRASWSLSSGQRYVDDHHLTWLHDYLRRLTDHTASRERIKCELTNCENGKFTTHKVRNTNAKLRPSSLSKQPPKNQRSKPTKRREKSNQSVINVDCVSYKMFRILFLTLHVAQFTVSHFAFYTRLSVALIALDHTWKLPISLVGHSNLGTPFQRYCKIFRSEPSTHPYFILLLGCSRCTRSPMLGSAGEETLS